jgi:hypothetical protein
LRTLAEKESGKSYTNRVRLFMGLFLKKTTPLREEDEDVRAENKAAKGLRRFKAFGEAAPVDRSRPIIAR